jgi:hypothetical protein
MIGPFASEETQLDAQLPRFLVNMDRGEVAVFPAKTAFVLHENGCPPQLYLDGCATYKPDVVQRSVSDQIVVGRVALSEVFDQPTDQSTFLVDLGALAPADLPQYATCPEGWPLRVAAHTEPGRVRRRWRHAPPGPYRVFVKLLMAHADGKATDGLYMPPRRFGKWR